MPIPALAAVLDVRALELARSKPIRDSANIPLGELNGRLGELSSRSGPTVVADTGPEAREAVGVIQQAGREASLVPAAFGGAFAQRRLWEPNLFLAEILPELEPGKALDVACGGGREAVFMAAENWEVVALDDLEENLTRGHLLAARYLSCTEACGIQWLNADASSLPESAERYDLITCFFFLDRDLFLKLPGLLRPGGRIVAETFTEEHRRIVGKPRSDKHVLRERELQHLFPGLKIERFEEGWLRGRHTQRVLGVRR